MSELKPCPFCGSKSLAYNWTLCGEGVISCPCGARMSADTQKEHYDLVSGDIYRKIPTLQGKDIVLEHWNRRANDV